MTRTSSLRVVDLFAGAGGMSAGFLRSDPSLFTHVVGVELDPAAAATYEANIGAVFEGSIGEWLESELPQADIVLGGPPCQGFSLLGKRAEDDPRNALWRAYTETIRLLSPSYFVMENVAAFVKSDSYRQMSRFFADDGYFRENYLISVVVVNASEFGAAQHRRRTLVLGRRKSLPELDLQRLKSPGQTVRNTIGQLPTPQGSVWPNHGKSRTARSLTTHDLHIGRNYTALSLSRFAAIPPGGNRFDLPPDLLPPCWRDHASGAGDVMGRLHWDKPSVTIRTEFFKPEKGRYLHPDQDRAITHTEAALLQGFPDDYQWFGNRTEIAKQIGNAVPLQLAEKIGHAISHAFQAAAGDGSASGSQCSVA